MKSKPQDLAQLLGQRFHQLQDKSGALTKINQTLMPLLPPESRSHVTIGNLRGGTLVLNVSSAGWATRLQYQRLELLSELRRNGLPMLTTIEFKVNPGLRQAAVQKPENTNKLSPTAGEHLRNAADSIGGELGDKLKRLAAHAGRPKSENK